MQLVLGHLEHRCIGVAKCDCARRGPLGLPLDEAKTELKFRKLNWVFRVCTEYTNFKMASWLTWVTSTRSSGWTWYSCLTEPGRAGYPAPDRFPSMASIVRFASVRLLDRFMRSDSVRDLSTLLYSFVVLLLHLRPALAGGWLRFRSDDLHLSGLKLFLGLKLFVMNRVHPCYSVPVLSELTAATLATPEVPEV